MKLVYLTLITGILLLAQSYAIAPVRGPARLPISHNQRLEYMAIQKGSDFGLVLWLDQSFQERRYEPGWVYVSGWRIYAPAWTTKR